MFELFCSIQQFYGTYQNCVLCILNFTKSPKQYLLLGGEGGTGGLCLSPQGRPILLGGLMPLLVVATLAVDEATLARDDALALSSTEARRFDATSFLAAGAANCPCVCSNVDASLGGLDSLIINEKLQH